MRIPVVATLASLSILATATVDAQPGSNVRRVPGVAPLATPGLSAKVPQTLPTARELRQLRSASKSGVPGITRPVIAGGQVHTVGKDVYCTYTITVSRPPTSKSYSETMTIKPLGDGSYTSDFFDGEWSFRFIADGDWLVFDIQQSASYGGYSSFAWKPRPRINRITREFEGVQETVGALSGSAVSTYKGSCAGPL